MFQRVYLSQSQPALYAYLNSGSVFAPVSLLTLSSASGTQRWTDGAQPVTYGGSTWSTASQGVITLERLSMQMGQAVSDFEVRLAPGPSGTAVLPTQAQALGGFLDGMTLRLDLAYLSGSAVVGTATLFQGVVTAGCTTTEVVLTARSPLASSDGDVPWRRYQSRCPFCVYDSGCGASPTSLSQSLNLLPGSSNQALSATFAPGLTPPGSLVRFMNGPLAGTWATVKGVNGDQYGVGTITLTAPLYTVPAGGTGVQIWRGCAGTVADCRVLSNTARFGGFMCWPSGSSD